MGNVGHEPHVDEMMVLGLSSSELVARLARLRIANDTPLAIERAAISASVLPDPEAIGSSLYAALELTGVPAASDGLAADEQLGAPHPDEWPAAPTIVACVSPWPLTVPTKAP